MKNLKFNARSFALLLAFLVVPRFSNFFSSVMVANKKGWSWEFDPVILVGYIILIILGVIFWQNENKAANITKEMPYKLITITLLVLILIPLLGYIGFDVLQFRPVYSLFSMVISWAVLIMVVFIIPILLISGSFSNQQKTFAILAALAYLISPTLGPVFLYLRLTQRVIEFGGLGLFQAISIVLLAAYFLFVVLLYATEREAQGISGFAAFNFALAAMVYGLVNPVKFGSRAGTYVVTTYVNGVPVGSSIMQAFQVNITVILAVLLLFILVVNVNRRENQSL